MIFHKNVTLRTYFVFLIQPKNQFSLVILRFKSSYSVILYTVSSVSVYNTACPNKHLVKIARLDTSICSLLSFQDCQSNYFKSTFFHYPVLTKEEASLSNQCAYFSVLMISTYFLLFPICNIKFHCSFFCSECNLINKNYI